MIGWGVNPSSGILNLNNTSVASVNSHQFDGGIQKSHLICSRRLIVELDFVKDREYLALSAAGTSAIRFLAQ